MKYITLTAGLAAAVTMAAGAFPQSGSPHGSGGKAGAFGLAALARFAGGTCRRSWTGGEVGGAIKEGVAAIRLRGRV